VQCQLVERSEARGEDPFFLAAMITGERKNRLASSTPTIASSAACRSFPTASIAPRSLASPKTAKA
jgi:hypothetical protein